MDPKEIMDRLSEPFDAGEVKFKPQSVKGNRALAVAYIDARLVMDRLDDVFGVGGWQDEYQPMPNGSIMCRLSVKIGEEWVTKADVGSESEQPDEHDRTKAAFSDALKRAAVKLGIGRYIYRLPLTWCDYDMARKQFSVRPQLPKWALPAPVTHAAALPAKDPYPERAPDEPKALPAKQPTQEPSKATAKNSPPPAKTPRELRERMGQRANPKSGQELFDWLESVEAKLKEMGSPSSDVFAPVMSMLKLATDVEIKAVTNLKDIESAWAAAKNFVKLQGDLAGAPK